MSRRRKLLIVPAWYPNREDPNLGVFNRNTAAELAATYDLAVLYVHAHSDAMLGNEIEIERGRDFLEIVVYARRRGLLPGPLGSAAFPFFYARHFKRGWARLQSEFGAPDLMALRNIFPCGFGALAVHRRTGVPYVTRESHYDFPRQLRSPVKRRAARMICEGARANSAVGSWMRDQLASAMPGIAFDVVPNTIGEVRAAEAEPLVALSAGDITSEARIIYLGGAIDVKGWDLALQAVRRCVDRGRHRVRLTMAGPGDAERLARKIAELELAPFVDAVGPRPHDEVLRLIAEHHFLILPSRRDTSPNVVLESLAVGRPVLATRSGGAVDFVNENNGLLVEAGSAEALAEGIERMIEKHASLDPAAIRRGVLERHSTASLVHYLDGFFP